MSLFRQAFAYAEKVQQLLKSATDPRIIFEPNITAVRTK